MARSFKYLVLIITSLISFSLHSQNRLHVRRVLNPSYDISRAETSKPVDNLGQILLSAYLDGKINGYKFAVGDSVTNWSEPDEFPPDWQKDFDYYSGDKVTYSGEAYLAIIDSRNQPPSSGEDQYWQAVVLREPISRIWYFPTIQDTLPKAEFLERMVLSFPIIFPEWRRDMDYYIADRVDYEERTYQAISHVPSFRNPPNINYTDWAQVVNGLEIGLLKDCNVISSLFNYTINGKDTLWTPEILTVSRFDYNVGAPLELCHFYYSDVQKYLQTISQPATNNFKYGYVGNNLFELTPTARTSIQSWIKTKIRTKQLKIVSDQILNSKLYNEWLSETILENDWKWNLFQDLNTMDLSLSKAVEWSNKISTPFLTISIESVLSMLKKEKLKVPEIVNYSTILNNWNRYFITYPSFPLYDSLPALRTGSNMGRQLRTEYTMIEAYQARVDSTHNSDFGEILPLVWKEIEQEYFKGELTCYMYDNRHRFFSSDNYDWSSVVIDRFGLSKGPYTFNSTFSLSGGREKKIEYMPAPTQFVVVEIVYQKKFNFIQKVTNGYFKPIILNFFFMLDSNGYDVVSFEWDKIKPILMKAPKKYVSFIDAIENGKLNFSNSELVYGIKEK